MDVRQGVALAVMSVAVTLTALNLYAIHDAKRILARLTPHNDCEGPGWKRAYGAPRDGTVIELCSTYGSEPWYAFAKWGKQFHSEETWEEQPDGRFSVSDSETLWWKPIPEGGKLILRSRDELYPGEEFVAGVIELPLSKAPILTDDTTVWDGDRGEHAQ